MSLDQDPDRSKDTIDQGAETAQLFLDANLSAQLGRSAPEKDARFDGEHCVEESCEAALPRERIAMGKIRCIICQTAIEQAGKQYRRV
jgi:hypothetical protein